MANRKSIRKRKRVKSMKIRSRMARGGGDPPESENNIPNVFEVHYLVDDERIRAGFQGATENDVLSIVREGDVKRVTVNTTYYDGIEAFGQNLRIARGRLSIEYDATHGWLYDWGERDITDLTPVLMGPTDPFFVRFAT